MLTTLIVLLIINLIFLGINIHYWFLPKHATDLSRHQKARIIKADNVVNFTHRVAEENRSKRWNDL